MFARAMCGVVLAMVSGCGSPKPAFDVAEVCAGKAPGGEVMVFRMHEPGAENLAYDLRLALTQQPESAARDAAIAELDIFRVAVDAGRTFSEQTAERERSIRDELANVRDVLRRDEPDLVKGLSNRDGLAESMQHLLADPHGARQVGKLREILAAGKLAGSAGPFAEDMAALAELVRRVTVDGDAAQALETLSSLDTSMRSKRATFESTARMLDDSRDLSRVENRADLWVGNTLSVWIDLVIVTARLADRWPDSIGVVRLQTFEAPRRGWAVTCIAPTTAAFPAEFVAATPTLVAARDTLGAALAIVPTTAPSSPPTTDELYAVLPDKK